MGIHAGVRLPKSSLVVVAIYVLCSAIHAVTKTFQRLRSLITYTLPSPSVNRSPLAPKGLRVAWKTQPWSRMEGLCVVCQGEVGEGDEIRELRECLHTFHKDCLDGWVEEGHCTCPLCSFHYSVATEYVIGRRIWESGRSYYCVTKGVPFSSVPRRNKPRRVDLYYSSRCIRAVESSRGNGQLTACEVLLFHHEDMGIPWEIAKLGVRQCMWGPVKKIEPGLCAYKKERAS